MTKIKKVVALALAFLMIFSSASVLANAWTVTVDDGFNLAIGTKFFINDGTEWVETEKVAPGDNVKARVYIGTDYYSNSSTLLFFYDKDFFTHGYNGISDISVNPEVGAFTGKLNPAPVLTSQVNAGYIDSAFLDEYAAISVNLFMPSGSTNAMYDDSTWIFEFDLTIAETATGEGDLFVKDTTVQNSTSQNKALVNVPKGPEGGTNADVWPMWRWNANVTLTSQPVSVDGSVTFNANSGKFADGTDKAVVNGIISKEYEVPANPTRDGYTFIGWIDATDTTPTYEEAQATVLVDAIPYEPVAYNAYWIKNVNITFNTDGGTEIAAHENVTPYTEFAAVEAPTKSGYTFVGWDVRGNMTLPETYPDVNTTYTAIWAKDVIVSFNTNGAAAIESIEGVAGEAFEAEIADPSKEGHRFVKWSPALPTVFPEADTTYNAIFEANIYPVYYYVDGVRVLNTLVEYGMEIPTSIGTVVPDGMTLSAWYTDEGMTQEFVAGTKMGTQAVSLYAEYEYKTYNAIFDANGGKFADGNGTVSVPTVYLDDIVAPAAPTKAGYEFAGWTPLADGTSFDEANDMYFYATWVELERTVEYYANGSLYETFNLNTGDEFDVPADAYKEGYSFLYWSETEGGAEATLPATMPELETAEPLKYYAVFEINEYTITWNVDGVETEATYEYDEVIVAVDNPAKTGYTFAGWDGYTDGMKMPAEDVTATAKWTIETYTLKFDTVGGNTIGDITADYGTDITVPADPTKEGHTFTGWSDTIPTVMPDLGENGATKTFTASWSVNNYTVTWIVDGVEDTDTYAYGAAITAPAPTKTGYVFAGWDAEVPATMPANNLTFTGSWNPATDTKYTVNIHTMDVDGNYVTSTEELTGTTDSTVYAQYTVEEGFELGANSVTEGKVAADGSLVLDVYLNRKTVTISFNTDGGSAVNAINGLYGAAVNVTEETTKKGYDFAGWENLPSTFPAADAEVKALWTAKTYNATFDAAGGQFEGGAATVNVPTVFNEAIVAPAVPTMKGHDFAGWTPEVGSMTEEGMTFTAVWTKNTYDATFIVDGEVYDTKPTVFGEAIELPAVPTKPGYVFSTWTPSVGNMTEEGMTFTAEWINATDTKYTVTVYTMNTDGTYGEGVTSTYAGETGTEAKAEGKYTISEGFKLSEVKENILSGTIAADGSLALVVYIDRIEYTFTVNVDGETTSTNYLYGATVAAPETPVKDGYTFSAWTPEVPATMPAENVEVVAGWTKNENTAYKVIVNYTDAKTGEAVATEKNYTGTTENAIEIVEAKGNAENTEYVLLSDLIPTHYQLDTSAANQLTGTVAADGSTVLNIYLVPVKYTATFTTGEGAFADGSTSYEVELDYYSLVSDYAPAEVPTREGHSFDSWRNADTTHIAADREFPAKWNIESYTIILDAAGGTVSPESITADYGAAINPVADPVKEGHSFTGWSEEIPTTMPDLGENGATKTITATWSVNDYTVTWIVDGVEDTDTYAYGAAITAPAPTKTGYVFAGWDAEVPATMPADNLTFTGSWNPATDTKYTVNIHTMDVDGNYVTSTEELTGTTDSTVYAQYTVEEGFELGANSVTEGKVAADGSLVLDVYINRKTFTITFAETGDEATAPITGLYGTTVKAPDDPTKTGYTFTGWDKPIPGTLTKDETITATWNINSYTVTWIVDGETKAINSYEYGKDIASLDAPSKDGYVFAGWAWTNEDGETVAAPTAMPAYNVTATATWANATDTAYTVEIYTMNAEGGYDVATSTKYGETGAPVSAEYTVENGFELGADSVTSGTIAADGSTVLKVYLNRKSYTLTVIVDDETTTSTVLYGAAVSVAAPSKEGYDFAGWDNEVPATMPADDVTLTAQWTVLQYTVTFVVDGVEDVKTLDYGAAIEATKPAKEGYRFVGWADETGALATVPATMPANNLKFTAVFETLTYIVYYYVDGALVDTLSGEYGDTIATTGSYSVPVGYELDGWYTDAACETKLADGATIGAASTSVYAKTVAKMYDAIFMVDGEVYETVSTAFDSEIIAPEDPAKEGYVFTGWTPVVGIMDTEGATFTATWKEGDYSVTYKAEGMKDEVFGLMFGEELDVPADPYKEGYTFKYWSLTEGGEEAQLPATMPAENLVYYAVFEINEYTVTWVIDGVETVDTVKYGAAITAPATDKEGFSFLGWSLTADGEIVEIATVMGAENLKYYAVYEAVATVKIKLVPIEGSTGVVERNGAIESYNDGYTVTDAEYDTPANYDEYYVYGLTGRRINAASINTHFTVNDTENGYFVLENSELSGTFGTGAKIKVYDKNGTDDTADDILVEEFYVIIFGDINGDAKINVADTADLAADISTPTWSNRRNPVKYRVKSADLDLSNRINVNDSAALKSVVSGGVTIDQTTGLAS